jgi:hypothetical protein
MTPFVTAEAGTQSFAGANGESMAEQKADTGCYFAPATDFSSQP